MTIQEKFELWKREAREDADVARELDALTDSAEIRDRFCRDLAFGTGGLRGGSARAATA